MTQHVSPNDLDFEVLLRAWLNEWNTWCKEEHKKYKDKLVPQHIEKQQQNFRVWLSVQKDIIVLDMHRKT